LTRLTQWASNTKDMKQPGEDSRQSELDTAIEQSLQHNQFRTGALLSQARTEKLFSPYGNFRDWVVGRFRMAEQEAYRLLDADSLWHILKKHDCPDPLNERQIRSLATLKTRVAGKRVLDEKKIVLAWVRACQQKKESRPTWSDVAREVRRLRGHQPDEDTDENSRAFRKALGASREEYEKGHKLLQEGKLDGFLVCDDDPSVRRLRAVVKALGSFIAKLASDRQTFQDALTELEE
jgi:hypothetical protein